MSAPSTAPAPAAEVTTTIVEVTTTIVEAPTTIVEAPATNLGDDADRTDPCASADADTTGTLANLELVETSGLVASRNHADLLWAHNDGGDRPGVFAVGADGGDLGLHRLAGVDAVDVEDIAIMGSGADSALLLGDIGDNGQNRETISVFRFPEPDPVDVEAVADVEIFTFRYPDRPHNAETLLVDESTNRIVIVTKEQDEAAGGRAGVGRTQSSLVFEGDLAGHGSGPVDLVEVGTLDTVALESRMGVRATAHPTSVLGFGGVPTGGDVSPDGSLIALRTYATVWVWTRRGDQSVAEALQGDPCEVVSAVETQGESIAFDGDALVTVSEGAAAPLHRLHR
jgi:hypothetical protein